MRWRKRASPVSGGASGSANASAPGPAAAAPWVPTRAMANGALAGCGGRVWFANFIAHVLVAGAAYAAYAWTGRRLARLDAAPETPTIALAPLSTRQRLTLVLIAGWIAGV